MLTPCCICQEARTDGLSALSCGHIFHHACNNRRCPLCRQLVKGSVKLVLDTSDIVKCGNCNPEAINASKDCNPEGIHVSREERPAAETQREFTVISDTDDEAESEASSIRSEDSYDDDDRDDLEDRLHESETQRAQLISRVDNLMRQLAGQTQAHEREMTERHVLWIKEQQERDQQIRLLSAQLDEAEQSKAKIEQDRNRYHKFLRQVTADRDALQREVESLKHLRVAREVHRAIFETEAGEDDLIKSLQTLGPEALLDSIRQLSRLSRQSQREKEEVQSRMQQEQVEREGFKRKLSKLQEQCQIVTSERDEQAQEIVRLKQLIAELRPQPVSSLSIVHDENVVGSIVKPVRPPALLLPTKITSHAKRVAGQHPDGSGGSTKVYFR